MALTADPFRVYEAEELGRDGYPLAWSRIGPDGEPAIKELVREQAGHRCVRCGHPYRKGEHGNGEWSPCDERCRHQGPFRVSLGAGVPKLIPAPPHGELPSQADGSYRLWAVDPRPTVEAAWRILTVHHLSGHWRNTAEAKRDCRWFNLVALCQVCHLQIQGKVVMERPWPWEHSGWMKPYVAGFYAVTFAGVELSRPEVEARLDELLSLGARESAVERMPV